MKLLGWTGATIGSALGWWIGNFEGIGTAIALSSILTIVGFYYGWKLGRRWMGY